MKRIIAVLVFLLSVTFTQAHDHQHSGGDGDEEEEPVLGFQLLACGLIFSAGAVCAIPLLANVQNYFSDKALALGNVFSGGVFLAAGMLHVLPEARKQYNMPTDVDTFSDDLFDQLAELNNTSTASASYQALLAQVHDSVQHVHYLADRSRFPAVECAALVGFIVVLFVEKIIFSNFHDALHHHEDGHGHSHGHSQDHQNSGHHHNHNHNHSHNNGKIQHNQYLVASESDDHHPEHDHHEDEHRNSVYPRESALSMMTEMLPHEAGDKPGHSQGMLDPELSYHDLESSSSLSSAPVATGTSLGSGIGAYILLLALSIHAFFEGLALGMQDSPGEAMILFIAIISHKACESFGLTVALMKAKTSTRHAFGLLMLFSSVSPLGQLVGIFLTQYNFMSRMATALVTAVAAGMFIYVGATEIIPEEFAKPTHKWHKFLLFMLGFVCAVVLVILTAHDH